MDTSELAPRPASAYAPLTVRLMVQLAAPHTWPASILPVLLAAALVIHDSPEKLAPVPLFVLLAISILMQSAVNTLNDYFDFVKGADTVESQPDPNDAVLVFNNVRPRSVLLFFVFLMLTAFVLGLYIIWLAGWIPLVIGAIGAATIYCYSGGRRPISYLPLGELTSGVVMGGLITLACVQALTREFSWLPLLFAVPVILGIWLIMFTNNTCDIEKDKDAQRKTMSVTLGRTWSGRMYKAFVGLWMAAIAILVVVYFPNGWIILPFHLLVSWPFLQALLSNPLVLQTRIAAMAQILTVNVLFGVAYALEILADVCLK